ncbi:MAG: hypothetical protein H0W06_05330 [Chloroflexia bacterium]|nr:hypothetical protein [Chloroflexia bacterium]
MCTRRATRRSGLFLAVLLLLLMGAGSAAPTAMAKGELHDELFTATLDPMPPAPVPAALARITFAPGAGLSMTANPGPALHFVESGGFDVTMLGDGALERAGATTPDQATPVAEGEAFTINPGDVLVIPATTPFEVFNTGTAPAVALIVEFFPRDLSAPLPEGISLEPLVGGEATSMPSGAADVALTRTTLEPNGTVMPEAPTEGPALIFIEDGQASFQLIAGEAAVTTAPDAATPSATPAASQTAPTNQEVMLSAGAAIFAQTGIEAGVRNAGTDPLVYLTLTITPSRNHSATLAT